MQPIIEIRDIGKKYSINRQKGGYIALRDVLTGIFKNPFRFAKAKAKQFVGIDSKEEFWALRHVNAEIHKGEVIGVIGQNGAGKSTLLKVLTGITPPTEGEVILRGRVASLLEVGTGFHPELSGRENIFLNGAILGMSRREIANKFQEIVAFAGIERFLDTPVKYYSSGMYVRLAFSVAAHMDPDILLVDEVLAVGDAEFQKKCLGKMEEVTKESGRTILFVSHNMGAVQALCKRSILLDGGTIKAFDDTDKILELYSREYAGKEQKQWVGEAGDEQIRVTRTYIKSLDDAGVFHTAADVEIGIEGDILAVTKDLILGFSLFSEFGQKLAYCLYDDREDSAAPIVEPGHFLKRFVIPANSLGHGKFRIEFDVGVHNHKRVLRNEGYLAFSMSKISGLGRRFPWREGLNMSSYFRPDWAVKE